MPAKRDHCWKGHPRTPENVQKNKSCRLCMQERRFRTHPPKPKKTHCSKGHPKVPENLDKHSSACLVCRKEKNKRWCEVHPDYRRRKSLSNSCEKRGITVEQFREIRSAQGNKCAICLVLFDELTKVTTPHIDHDHATGANRGLLCTKCNTALGFFDDDLNRFLNAVTYLDNPPAEPILTGCPTPVTTLTDRNQTPNEANLSANIN